MIPIERLSLTGVYGQVLCEPNWRWNTLDRPLHDYVFWYVWSGEGTLILNGESYSLTKGSCFLFREGDRTLAEHNPLKPLNVSFLHFEIAGDCTDSAQTHKLPAPYRLVRDTTLLETLLNRYVRTLNERSYRYEEEAKLLLSLMLHFLDREHYESRHTPLREANVMEIHELANYIRQYPGVWHRIADLAPRTGLSPRYCALKFKEIMGLSIENFIIQERVRRAEHLLKYNQMRVSEVSDALGYKNMYYFSRQFKKYTGRTPSQVRNG